MEVRVRPLKGDLLFKGSCSDMVENRTIPTPPPTLPPTLAPTATARLRSGSVCIYRMMSFDSGPEQCYNTIETVGHSIICPTPYESWSSWNSIENGFDVRTRRMSSDLANFEIEFDCDATETDKRPTPFPIKGNH